jgi:hypothetical protein
MTHGNATHRDTQSREYKTWIHLRRKRRSQTCPRWNNSYEDFLSDMGRCPDNLVLGRFDNEKKYGPYNCAWMTRKQMTRYRHQKREIDISK